MVQVFTSIPHTVGSDYNCFASSRLIDNLFVHDLDVERVWVSSYAVTRWYMNAILRDFAAVHFYGNHWQERLSTKG